MYGKVTNYWLVVAWRRGLPSSFLLVPLPSRMPVLWRLSSAGCELRVGCVRESFNDGDAPLAFVVLCLRAAALRSASVRVPVLLSFFSTSLFFKSEVAVAGVAPCSFCVVRCWAWAAMVNAVRHKPIDIAFISFIL